MSRFTPLFDSICTSARMADLPDDTCRMFYVWLLAKCDAWGRLDARPRKLNVSVWPLLGKSDAETARCLEALRVARLVDVYWPAGHDPFLQVPDWEEKAGSIGRKSHRSPSQHPDPASVADCKLPGEAGGSGRSRALPGEAGHASSPLLSDIAPLCSSERAREAAPVPSESAAPPRPRRTAAQPAEAVAARPEYAELLADVRAAEAWQSWLEWCDTAGARPKRPVGQQAARILNEAKRAGAERFAAAVDCAIAGNYLAPTYRDAPRSAVPAPHKSHGARAADELGAAVARAKADRAAGREPKQLFGGVA